MAKNLSRIVSKAITDETAEDTSSHGKHGHVKSIPGDYNGHTRKSINADFRASYKHLAKSNNDDKQSPKAEQTMTETRVRSVSPKILLLPAAKKEEEEEEDEEEEEEGDEQEEGEEQVEQVEEPNNRALIRAPPPSRAQYYTPVLRPSSRKSSATPAKAHALISRAMSVSTVSREPSPTASIGYRRRCLEVETTEEISTPSDSSEEGSIIVRRICTTLTEEMFTTRGGDVPYPSLSNYDSSEASSDFESDSGSDSERASIFSEDTCYTDEDTPSETDSDELSDEEEEEEEEQEYEAKSYSRADSSGEEPLIPDCNTPKIIVSIGPAKHCKWRVQPSKGCTYSIPQDLPEIKPRGSKSKWKATKVYGVAFRDDDRGPEVLRGKNSLRIYVKIGWNDGEETWERGADAKMLIAKHITTDISAEDYLYKAAVAFEKRADRFLEANKHWRYNR
ncbi:uncharacterized protein LAJ45_04767 [Morchella importuna]|uniref:uncharacterized protein n=1 Tax=Morchella importuna TaxID=1174673 RepID=UPI001E8CDE82|nr:uncharacterized protein LAJ45_04767 [Morchella importuna]KAH8151065.1 hypothetical protein LAJ45_04767 [Morchella importuna]